jgi:hypothetical protein
MCLKETCSNVRIDYIFSDTFPNQNNLKQGDVLAPLLFNFALDYTTMKVQENQVRVKLNVNLLGGQM